MMSVSNVLVEIKLLLYNLYIKTLSTLIVKKCKTSLLLMVFL